MTTMSEASLVDDTVVTGLAFAEAQVQEERGSYSRRRARRGRPCHTLPGFGPCASHHRQRDALTLNGSFGLPGSPRHFFMPTLTPLSYAQHLGTEADDEVSRATDFHFWRHPSFVFGTLYHTLETVSSRGSPAERFARSRRVVSALRPSLRAAAVPHLDP